MAYTATDIAKLYIAMFDRAPEKEGLDYWVNEANSGKSLAEIANEMAAAAKAYPDAYPQYANYDPTNPDSVKAVIEEVYKTLFNKDYTADPEGIDYWVNEITSGNMDLGTAVVTLEKAAEEYLNSDDPAAKAAAEAFMNKVEVALYTAENIPTADINGDGKIDSTDFSAFKEVISIVTNDPATIEQAKVKIEELKTQVAAQMMNKIELTTGDDSITGTDGNDYFDATTPGTLGNNDVILDNSTTDEDILAATVNSANIAPRINNVEILKITGEYVTTGLDLSVITNAKEAIFDTKLPSGTATVSNVNSIEVSKITAGINISTLNVTSSAIGTRDPIEINAANADVNLTGNAGGADQFNVTMVDNKTLTLQTLDSAGDKVSVNALGDLTITNTTGTAANLELDINNLTSEEVTINLNDNSLIANEMQLNGNDIVIDAKDADSVDGLSITSSASNSTIVLDDEGDNNIDLTKAEVKNVKVNTALDQNAGATLNANLNSVVTLAVDSTQNNGLTINVDDADGNLATNGDVGALLLNVDASQTTNALTTGAQVGTLLLTPGALPKDQWGNTQVVTIDNLSLDNNTDTVVVTGSNPLNIVAVANNGDETIAATNMSGDLTINDLSNDAKVYTGSGNDTIRERSGAALEIYSGAGNDTVDLSGGAGASTINTQDGNDIVVTSGAGDTVDLGSGDDTVTITGTGDATITTGTGTDKVIADVTNTSTIKDFTVGTDTLELTGILAGNLDLTNLTQSDSTYDFDGDGIADDIELEGVNVTDLSNSIQLNVNDGGAALTIVAGSKDDTITTTSTSTITTGEGNDTVNIQANAGATITDFTNGNDKVVLTGDVAGSVDLTNVTVGTAGDYDIDGDGTTDFTLENHDETDLTSMVQLNITSNAAVAANDIGVVGSKFDDTITLNADPTNHYGTTVNFIDNGGFDTINSFTTGEDKLNFNDMTGIDSAADGHAGGTAVTARIDDAINGEVYVLDGTTSINNDTIDFNTLTVNSGHNVNDEAITFTSESFLSDVATYINNALGTTTGEHYVVIIEGGNVDDSSLDDSLIFYVNGDSEGVNVEDISLIGLVADVDVDASDIA